MVKKRGHNLKKRTSLIKQTVPSVRLPDALKGKAAQQQLNKLKQEDPSLLDKEDLTKDNQQFIGLAQKLKKLMVRKKRL